MPLDPYEQNYQNQVDESQLKSKVYNETIKALQSEERFVKFFEGYNAQSIEAFIKYYAQQKAHWYAHAASNASYRKQMHNEWRYKAVEMLREIFIKKLFNLKCRWIAGEMDLPGIETSDDFATWSSNPSQCKLIEPITREELELYLDYYKSRGPDYDDYAEDRDTSSGALGSYHLLNVIGIEPYDRPQPLWFEMYDRHFGTESLLHLPFTRMEIQQDYHDIWFEHIHMLSFSEEVQKSIYYLSRIKRKELRLNKAKRDEHFEEERKRYKEQQKNAPKYIGLSTYNREQMNKLVPQLESKEVQEYYRSYAEWHRRRSGNDEIESDVMHLNRGKERIPVESDDDYKTAIKNAFKDYDFRMRLETLPVIYEEYAEAMATGKPFNWKTNDYLDSFAISSANEFKQQLLLARKYRGEPENFDFLKKENLKNHFLI